MKAKSIVCTTIVATSMIASASLQAQAPQRTNAYWQPYFAGSAGLVEYGATASCVDAQGNVYIADNFQLDNKQPIRVAKWTGSHWQILGDFLYMRFTFTN